MLVGAVSKIDARTRGHLPLDSLALPAYGFFTGNSAILPSSFFIIPLLAVETLLADGYSFLR
jgi:hypothetical protein